MSKTKRFYLAALVPQENDSYFVYFPDIENGFTEGENIALALEMAEDVLKVQLQHTVAAKRNIPIPSDLQTVKDKTKAYLQSIDEDFSENIIYQYIVSPSLDMSPVRINISLPRAVLEEMDNYSHLHGLTRSGFIVEASKKYITAELTV